MQGPEPGSKKEKWMSPKGKNHRNYKRMTRIAVLQTIKTTVNHKFMTLLFDSWKKSREG
jgi:hypothetical protein